MTIIYISRTYIVIQVTNLNASWNMYEKSLTCVTLIEENVLNATQKSN